MLVSLVTACGCRKNLQIAQVVPEIKIPLYYPTKADYSTKDEPLGPSGPDYRRFKYYSQEDGYPIYREVE